MSAYGYGEDLIGYGVELSRKTARTGSRPRGRRGLDRNAILDAAFDMLSRLGEAGFSVRKLGARIGVDPMTVLHHFGSKDELLRAIADRALATVALPHPSSDWRADLRNVAAALPGPCPSSSPPLPFAFPLPRHGTCRSCLERGRLPGAAPGRAAGCRSGGTWACVLRLSPRLCLGRGRRAAAADRRGRRGGASRRWTPSPIRRRAR